MINYNKKNNKIKIKEQRILKAEIKHIRDYSVFRFAMPTPWGKDLELEQDDRYLLATLTDDKEIIIRKARPEDY